MPVFGATGAIGRLVSQRLRRFSDVQPELYVMSQPARGSGSGSFHRSCTRCRMDRRRVIESVIKTQRYPSLFKVALFNEIVERLT